MPQTPADYIALYSARKRLRRANRIDVGGALILGVLALVLVILRLAF